MIPSHVSEELKTLSKAQQDKFNELVAWSGTDVLGTQLPANYDGLLEMVKRMGGDPIIPVEPERPKDE